MKKLLFISFLFLSVWSYSQQSKIDSIKIQIKNCQTDSLKTELFSKIVQMYFNYNMREGLVYADSLLYYAEKQNNSNHICTRHRYYGNYYNNNGDYEQAIKEFRKSLRINDSINYPLGQYADYANIGNSYRFNKLKDSALFYYSKAINVTEKYKLKNRYTSAYLNIAGLYHNHNESKNAISYYLKALDSSYHLKATSKMRIAPIYNNLGTIFLDIKDYKRAEYYLNNGIALSKELNFRTGIADAELKLARLYYEKEIELDRAETMLKSCIQVYKDLGDIMFLAESYLNLGDLYIVKGLLDESIKAKKEAIKITKKTDLKDYYFGAVASIARSYYKQKKYKLSLENINSILKDSLDPKMNHGVKTTIYKLKSDLEYMNNNIEEAYFFHKKLLQEIEKSHEINVAEIVTDIETKYQTEKKEKENLQLKQEKAEQELALAKESRNKWLFGIGLLLSLFTLGVFGYYYKKTKKQKRFIESLQTELHHRIKNNLGIINGFIDVSKEKVKSKTQLDVLQELQNRIESIYNIHEQLYQSQDVTQLDMKKYLQKIKENVAQSLNNPNISIYTDVKDDLQIQADKSFPIGLIINEFITNSYKYAFKAGEKGSINIQLSEDKNNYNLKLSDNGSGLPTDFDIETTETFGMRILKLLAKQLEGTMAYKNNNGLHMTYEIPK